MGEPAERVKAFVAAVFAAWYEYLEATGEKPTDERWAEAERLVTSLTRTADDAHL